MFGWVEIGSPAMRAGRPGDVPQRRFRLGTARMAGGRPTGGKTAMRALGRFIPAVLAASAMASDNASAKKEFPPPVMALTCAAHPCLDVRAKMDVTRTAVTERENRVPANA